MKQEPGSSLKRIFELIVLTLLPLFVIGCSDPRHPRSTDLATTPEPVTTPGPSLPDFEASSGGNAGGYNGPHFPEYALDFTEQQGPSEYDAYMANSECLLTGNPSEGLLSLGQRLYRDVYKKSAALPNSSSQRPFAGSWTPLYIYDNYGSLPQVPRLEEFQYALKDELYFWALTPEKNAPEEELYSKSTLELHLMDEPQAILKADSMLPMLWSDNETDSDYFFTNFRPTIPEQIRFTKSKTSEVYAVDSQDHLQCLLNTLKRLQLEKDLKEKLALPAQAPDTAEYSKERISLCPELSTWMNEHSLVPSTQEHKLRLDAANHYYDNFETKGSFDPERVLKCTQGIEGRQNLYNSINQIFFERTLEKIYSFDSPTTRRIKMVLDIKRRSLGTLMIPFQKNLIVISQYDYPELPWSAAFSRDFGIMHFAMNKLHYNDWFFYFVHEFMHKLDRDLHKEADLSFGASKIKDRLPPYMSLDAPLDSRLKFLCLQDSDADKLFELLIQGLNSGLWAEYRAWYYTFRLYYDGLKVNKINRSPRAEALLNSITSNPSSLRTDLIRYMTARLREPVQPLWASGAGRRLYDEVLRLFDGENLPPPLGDLGQRLEVNRRQHFENFLSTWDPDRELEDEFDSVDLVPKEAEMRVIFQRLDSFDDEYNFMCP